MILFVNRYCFISFLSISLPQSITHNYKRMKRHLYLLLLVFSISIGAQNISGSWSGAMDVGASKLNITFNLSKDNNGKDVCTMDVPDQMKKNIPTELILLSADSLKLKIPALGVLYEGCLKDGIIKGTFTQAIYTLQLDLKPGKPLFRRPQTPQPPFAYHTEEVYFTNTEDNAKLCGTLTYPIGYDKMKKRSVPVVLMVTGSGLQNRDEELFDHKPFLVIADFLAKNGIASLRFDDRTMGKSTGDVKNATTYNFMKDAAAGLNYLRQRKEFGKVGAMGHSEGGTISFMLGGRQKTDFIISLAGTGVRGDSVLVSQNRIAMQQVNVPSQNINDYCNVLKKVYQYKIDSRAKVYKSTDNPEAVVDQIINEVKANLPSAQRANIINILNMQNPWINFFITYDPCYDISKTKCPVMAVNGSLDSQVMPQYNLETIKRLLPPNKKNIIKEYKGLNHLFQHCTTGAFSEYNKIEETFAPEVLQDMVGWIRSIAIN